MVTNPTEAERLEAAKACASDPVWLFTELNKRMKSCPASDAQLRVTTHIRERTGHATIAAFHNNGATKEQKVEIYQECLKAVMRNDFSTLRGSVPSGQAQVKAPTREEKPAQEAPRATVKPVEVARQETAIEVAPRATTPATTAPAGSKGEILAMLAKMLESSAVVDPDEVARIAKDICGSEIKLLGNDLRGSICEFNVEVKTSLTRMVDEYLKKVPPRDVIELRKWDGSVKEIKGLRHKQLALVIKCTAARNASGWPVPGWWYGSPGAGKTHLWRQVSEALGVKFYPIALGPTSTEGKLLGYKNLATGEFVTGHLYEPYKNGGLVNLDEVDICDPGVLVGANSISSNEEFMFPNGEVVKRHRDFYLCCSANTLGTGATGGFTRNKLDAATLDRFAKFRLEYDADLESALCGNKGWAAYVWKVREYVEKNCSQSIYITPRASINGAALLNAGVESEVVADATLFAMMSKDMRQTVIKNVGVFQ